MTLSEQRIDESATKVFTEYPDMTIAAGAGAHAAFRFLADNIVSDLQGDQSELETIYSTLFSRISIAKSGIGETYFDCRKIAANAFRLGMECGKSVNSTLRRALPEPSQPPPVQLNTAGQHDDESAAIWKSLEQTHVTSSPQHGTPPWDTKT